MKTVLITGASGFIGGHVARCFHHAGWRVHGLGRKPFEDQELSSFERYQAMTLPHPDLRDEIMRARPDLCVHCAGRASVDLSVQDPAGDFDAGVTTTFHLLDALRTHAPSCRLIYLSSAAVYGNPKILPILESEATAPISPYGFHKLMGEQLCAEFTRVYQLPTTIVRIFSAYGPELHRQVIWDIFRKAMTQSQLNLRGSGQESRDFIHVSDVAQAILLLAAQAPGQAEIYNLAGGTETTIRELAETALQLLERDIPLTFDGVLSPGTPVNWRADTGRLSALGFVARVPLRDGLRAYASLCASENVPA